MLIWLLTETPLGVFKENVLFTPFSFFFLSVHVFLHNDNGEPEETRTTLMGCEARF